MKLLEERVSTHDAHRELQLLRDELISLRLAQDAEDQAELNAFKLEQATQVQRLKAEYDDAIHSLNQQLLYAKVYNAV